MKELENMRNDELLAVIIAGIQMLRDNERKQGYADGKAETEEAEKKKQKCSTCRHNEGEHNPFDTCNHCNNGSEYEERKAQNQKCCSTCKYSYNPDELCKYFRVCLTPDKKDGIFGSAYSKYEPKQTEDEIKVGYEVYNIDRDNKRIVTAIDGNKAIQLCSNGKYAVDNIDTLRWTGREDLRIKKVLENITNKGES